MTAALVLVTPVPAAVDGSTVPSAAGCDMHCNYFPGTTTTDRLTS